MTEKKIDQQDSQKQRTAQWKRLEEYDCSLTGYRWFERFGLPVVAVVHLVIAAVVLSHLTWLNVVSQHPEMVTRLPGVLQGLAERWLAKNIVGVDSGLLVLLAMMLFAFQAAGILGMRLLSVVAGIPQMFRKAQPLEADELAQLRQICGKCGEMCRKDQHNDWKRARMIALAGDVLLGVGYIVFWTVYRVAIDTFGVKTMVLTVLAAAAFVAGCYFVFNATLLAALDPSVLYYRRWTAKTRTETEKLLRQRTAQLAQEEEERQAAERARKRQEAADRTAERLQAADELFAAQQFAEAVAAYAPLAEERIPRGRAGYVLAQYALKKPQGPERKAAVEELKSAIAAGLPPHVEAACKKAADSLIQTIREQEIHKCHRAQELMTLNHRSIGVSLLKEAAEAGLPEAVPVYVRAELEDGAPVEKYGELIQLMECARRFGFAEESARKEYTALMDGLYWSYGQYLTQQGQTHAGGYYILAAAHMGNPSAKAYLNPGAQPEA